MSPGKQFEADFRRSVSSFTYEYRLKDCPTGWTRNCTCDCTDPTRFAPRNDYDELFYYQGTLWLLELKSHNGTAFGFSAVTEKRTGKPNHQVRGLMRASPHEGIVAGFVINFRKYDETYYIPIAVFHTLFMHARVRSINLKLARECGVKIPQRKKIKNWGYDINDFVQRTRVYNI